MSIGRIRILALLYGLVFGFVIGDLFGNTLLYLALGLIVGFFAPSFLRKKIKTSCTNLSMHLFQIKMYRCKLYNLMKFYFHRFTNK